MRSEPLIDVQLVDHPVRVIELDPFPQPAGAECLFLGRTRAERHAEHGPLVQLVYHAYLPLAQRVLEQLAQRAALHRGCLAVRIHHALGPVAPGEASVLVQVVSGHRGAAFDAARWIMEELKRTVPIWKLEQWARGATWSSGTAVEAPPPTPVAPAAPEMRR